MCVKFRKAERIYTVVTYECCFQPQPIRHIYSLLKAEGIQEKAIFHHLFHVINLPWK
jgi:hypothetical protein